MGLRCHWPFNGCLCVTGLQSLRAAVRPASVFCKAFKAGKGMSFVEAVKNLLSVNLGRQL